MQSIFPEGEKEILRLWQENRIFEKSIGNREGRPDFIFYEGPPTANAKPGIHHVLARIFKDIICRYKTMQGFRVLRKAGWDTHGLPVEIEIEKKHGFKNKKDIESYGIAKFNQECRESVWNYKKDWEDLTAKIGYWLDMENPYITYDPGYMETVWFLLKKIWDKKLLYQDFKVVPWCPRCGTSLSSHEVAQGYEKVKDPAIYVKFKVKSLPRTGTKFLVRDEKLESDTFLLIWTTTPWTLPGNMAVAVNPKLDYVKIKIFYSTTQKEEYLILTKEIYEDVRKNPLADQLDEQPERIKYDLRVDMENVETIKGRELVGMEYEPPFQTESEEQKNKNIYQILAADFVTTEEGTGIVHIAPAFGQDDMELMKCQMSCLPDRQANVKCPAFTSASAEATAGRQNHNLKLKTKKSTEFSILINVDEEGKFTDQVPQWEGRLVTDPEVNEEIIKDLEDRGLLFKRELYEHDYPFCWRCKSKLIYYAKKSWFIKMTAVKDALLKNNRQINWVPEHLKEGRFGEWLNEVKDWALSRERFWGTPLPVWQCQGDRSEKLKVKNSKLNAKTQKFCDNVVVIGSREDLRREKFTTNQYYILRHGETPYQTEIRDLIYPVSDKDSPPALTESGRKQIEEAAKKLKKEKIDIIFASDTERTRQTAEIVAKAVGLRINFDSRLRDVDLGSYHGKPKAEFYRDFASTKEWFYKKPQAGESWLDAKLRMIGFLKEIDQRYKNKNILIVSHGDPLWLLEGAMKGFVNEDYLDGGEKRDFPNVGDLRKLDFKNFPFNEKGELDFHRPFIDEVRFFCPKCQGLMQRVPEVIDCWFDSGAMPFAQAHWPFAWAPAFAKASAGRQTQNFKPPELFPTDYIAEAIDQTRGWFYTLLAISTALGFDAPYKNVISVGHVLDEKGEKMSKSRGNVVDPWQMIEKYGADAIRWYFFTINQAGEPKLFSENGLKESLTKFLLPFWNTLVFLKTYGNNSGGKRQWSKLEVAPQQILNKWIVSRFEGLAAEMTKRLDEYDVISAARQLENFVVEDFSRWYVRRSRKNLQNSVRPKEGEETAKIYGFVLFNLARLSAPFVPFLAEKTYQAMCSAGNGAREFESVHFENWPEAKIGFRDLKLEEKMDTVRGLVASGLKARTDAGFKVRQPLASLKIKNQKSKVRNELEFLELLKEELNVKEIIFDDSIKGTTELDTQITPELKEEGLLREIIRNIQSLRKEAGLKPANKIEILFEGGPSFSDLLLKNKETILRETRAVNLIESVVSETALKKELQEGEEKIVLAIKLQV